VTVIVCREKSAVPTILKKDLEVVLRRERLDPGDYAVADGQVLVERKSMADFVGSLKSGRLFAQGGRTAAREHRPAHIVKRAGKVLVSEVWKHSFGQAAEPGHATSRTNQDATKKG